MAQRIEAVLERGVPWSPRAAWWLVTLEGLAALVIGLAIVLHPGNTRDVIVRLVGIYLVAAGLLGLVGDLRESYDDLDNRASLLRHGIMVIVGGAAVVYPKLPQLLAWGLVVAGIVGFISILAFRNMGEARLGVLALSGIFVVIGLGLTWALATGTFFIGIVGLAVVVSGCILIAYGLRLFRADRAATHREPLGV